MGKGAQRRGAVGEILKQAGMTPEHVNYNERHDTDTQAGDGKYFLTVVLVTRVYGVHR